MAGLVNYGSSDEEDDFQEDTLQNLNPAHVCHPAALPSTVTNGANSEIETNGETSTKHQRRESPAVARLQLGQTESILGPVLGPTTEIQMTQSLEDGQGFIPQSPYSANRALLRDLTLPTVPCYDIPPSPPGSPIPSTNTKFERFLELKKHGVHFNAKLAKSSALKNPSLMQKLMDFADIDENSQYATTLPHDLWSPGAFPKHAYKEELVKSQQKISKRREEEKARGQREAVDFVPATLSGESSRSGTPNFGVAGRMGQKSAAERIMAGLDRGRSNSPQLQGAKRKTRFES